MTPCLQPEEFVDLVDGTLAPDRRRHVDGCAACQATAREIREALTLAASDDVPEPSALFWPSINARVRAQLDARPGPAWQRWLRGRWLVPAAALAAMLVALAVSIQRARPDLSLPLAPPHVATTPLEPVAVAALDPPPDVDLTTGDGALALVVDLSRDLPDGGWDTLGISTLPDLAEAAAVLSRDEQEALAALLRSAVDRPKS
jgi:hypothetical protein